MNRPQIVVLNKGDMLYDGREKIQNVKNVIKSLGYSDVFEISAVTGNGLLELLRNVKNWLIRHQSLF